MKRKAPQDILNPVDIRWWGMYENPDFPKLDSDIDYTVQLGDRLDRLAYSFYGSQWLWWVIAGRNELDDPVVDLHMGIQIVIPSPGYVKQSLLRKKVGSGR